MSELATSRAIEQLMVALNPRNMRLAQAALTPGYYLRAAHHLQGIRGAVIIGTGFPVLDTFETDGPVGAIALYNCLEKLGAHPHIACGPWLAEAISEDYRVIELRAADLAAAEREASECLQKLQPDALIAIERPGLAVDGRYYNMRGEDISARCSIFDPYIEQATCPTIAIGDGGNEIGMANVGAALAPLDITVSRTGCDELLVADVSNWAAYGLIAFLSQWAQRDLLADVAPTDILAYLAGRGSLDGVTRENTLTEDGLHAREGLRIIEQLRRLTGFID